MNTNDEQAQTDGWKDQAERQQFLDACKKLSEELKKLAEILLQTKP